MKNQTIAVEVLPDGSQVPMDFRRLVEVNGVCVDETPTVVYNSLCESFESKRFYCETLGKWM